MTTREWTHCDSCTNKAKPDGLERWGQLHTRGSTGAKVVADICPRCIAKIHGWADPLVAGTGLGVHTFHRKIRAGPSAIRPSQL